MKLDQIYDSIINSLEDELSAFIETSRHDAGFRLSGAEIKLKHFKKARRMLRYAIKRDGMTTEAP